MKAIDVPMSVPVSIPVPVPAADGVLVEPFYDGAAGVASTPKPEPSARERRPVVPHAAPARAEAGRLTESAISLGQTWAEECRAELLREGRPAAGGWPGTLREARVRVERLLLGKLSPRHLAAVTGDEREVAARAAYASARVEWCRRAEPEAP